MRYEFDAMPVLEGGHLNCLARGGVQFFSSPFTQGLAASDDVGRDERGVCKVFPEAGFQSGDAFADPEEVSLSSPHFHLVATAFAEVIAVDIRSEVGQLIDHNLPCGVSRQYACLPLM